MITRLFFSAVAAASVAVLAPSAASAAAGPVVQPLATSPAEQQAVLDYWTPDRLSALTQPSSDNPPKAGPDGAPWTQPAPTVGRLFFTDHGEDVSCTATVVDSANRSTIVTAGHCVNNTDLIGEHNAWNTHSLFIPGYHDGQAPYGKFVARAGVADATWLQNDQINAQKFDSYDQAFVVLNAGADGHLVQDTVGAAQHLGFDLPGDADVHQFGYPRAASDPAREGLPEYTGARLAFCHGPARHWPGTPDAPDSADQWGTACVMGGGSSGGPRLRDFDPATGLGTVVGDNTHAGFFDASGKPCTSADGCTRYLVGPQFSEAVTKPLYEAAQHA
ncbi:trypsin-like serine peptidase [Amycolatopsis sp. NPDC051903]|uniref:trypsin-like serine peptidase n=1 Tax=Amycolatopsis sp. NPDC051903 TaxID=3363936 RepID=UPI0037B17A0E